MAYERCEKVSGTRLKAALKVKLAQLTNAEQKAERKEKVEN
jgi:hypothetical protein